MDLWVEGWICEIRNGLWKFGNLLFLPLKVGKKFFLKLAFFFKLFLEIKRNGSQ